MPKDRKLVQGLVGEHTWRTMAQIGQLNGRTMWDLVHLACEAYVRQNRDLVPLKAKVKSVSKKTQKAPPKPAKRPKRRKLSNIDPFLKVRKTKKT